MGRVGISEEWLKAIILPVEPIEQPGDKPSKSALKREMTDLQALGAELVALSVDQLKKIDLPEDLRDAVRDGKRFTQHEAHRRQLQYIGKLMRSIDAAPIRAALDEINGVSAAATARMHALERLRERVRDRFQRVLGEARYGGVLRALAIGDDDAIKDEDWQIFRRTGVVHLMSISGLVL